MSALMRKPAKSIEVNCMHCNINLICNHNFLMCQYVGK